MNKIKNLMSLAIILFFFLIISIKNIAAENYPTRFLNVKDQTSSSLISRSKILPPLSTIPSKINIKKLVSIDGGQTFVDADEPPGPIVPVETPLFFKLVVTNTGSSNLLNITIRDSEYSADSCDPPKVLYRGKSFECVIGPFCAQGGQQVNISNVTANSHFKLHRITLQNEDGAHYFGFSGCLEQNDCPRGYICDSGSCIEPSYDLYSYENEINGAAQEFLDNLIA